MKPAAGPGLPDQQFRTCNESPPPSAPSAGGANTLIFAEQRRAPTSTTA